MTYGAKAFEQIVIGPRTPMRTWGTRLPCVRKRNPPRLLECIAHGISCRYPLSTRWSLDQAGRRHTRIGEEATPGGIEIKPALGAEPARRELGNMQQTMTAGANQLRAVPCQEVS